jgi:peptide/nickel transport system permease protein
MKRRMPLSANGMIGCVLIGLVLLAAMTALVWTPYNPLAVNLQIRLQAPSSAHLLGTDEFGRDVLSRAMAGAAASGQVAALTVAFAVSSGLLVGVLTGFFRGWTDRILSAFNDAMLAFPGILLALAVMMVVGANRYGIIIALGLAYAPTVVRVVRGTVLSLREKEYVEASRMIGNPEWLTMWRHILPNCMAPVAVLTTSMFGWVLLSESALSFLGLGVPPPAPTWGNMLAASRQYMQNAMWLGLVPGLCISMTLLGINLLGDAVRDRFDPLMVGK